MIPNWAILLKYESFLGEVRGQRNLTLGVAHIRKLLIPTASVCTKHFQIVSAWVSTLTRARLGLRRTASGSMRNGITVGKCHCK